MARRRKDNGLVAVFIALPWWASVVAGCVAYAALQWVVPSMVSGNRLLAATAEAFRSIAWLPLLVFAAIGFVSFVRSKSQNQNRPVSVKAGTKARIAKPQATLEPFSNMEHAWGSGTPLPAGANPTGPDIFSDAHAWGNRSQESQSAPPKRFHTWSLEALRALEWKRFELLCAKYYEAVGFKPETLRCGPDGGIDVKLFRGDQADPLAVVQCKAWNTAAVGVKEVRELLGVMAHEKVRRGVFITTGTFTPDAVRFAVNSPIQLLDGASFIKKIESLAEVRKDALLKFAFEGDYHTPTCASCGIKMIKREGKQGAFWGCTNFPRCRSTFPIRG